MTAYYNKVYKPRWDKWHGKVEALEKELDEQMLQKIERQKVSQLKIEEAKLAHLKKQQSPGPEKEDSSNGDQGSEKVYSAQKGSAAKIEAIDEEAEEELEENEEQGPDQAGDDYNQGYDYKYQEQQNYQSNYDGYNQAQ